MKRFPYFALVLAGGGALAALASAVGFRLGLWQLNTAFAVLRGAAIVGVAAVVSCAAVAIWARNGGRRGMLVASLCGVLAGGLAFGVPFARLQGGKGLPAIHDITTDPVHPPPFVALRAARLASPNGIEYGGRHVAQNQRAAYPDIVSLSYTGSATEAFARSLDAVKRRGWEIAAADAADMRIEATERSFFFGFSDDVVIRITESGRGARIDVRSVSRIGGSDFGVNARRVRALLRELAAR